MEAREIKFRAWITPLNSEEESVGMRNITFMELPSVGKVAAGQERYDTDLYKIVLMQYTGLLDKNGKEIYEGDIIHSDAWNPDTYQVLYDRGAFYIAFPDKHEAGDIKYAEKFEIIGNIYENPELLTNK